MDILGILDSKNVPYEHKGGEEYAIVCPAQHLHQDGKDSRPSFSINIEKQVGHCMVCNYSLSQAGLYSWLMGEELDDLHMKALEIKGVLNRIGSGKQSSLYEEESEFFFPVGSPWEEDGYRGISIETYQELGAIKVTRGRYQNRICFPIYVNGELVGVDARYLGNDKEDKVAKYLRNKDSSCKTNWLFPFDKVKAQKPSLVILGEGLFHAINAFDKGFSGLCFFGVNNFSNNKVSMLLSLGAEEICYFPDPDKAGFQAMQRVCAALSRWFKVSIANIIPYVGTKVDLGDMSREEIDTAVRTRVKPVYAKCLVEDWQYKVVFGEKCKRWKCPFNSKGCCNNEAFKPDNQ